jgi:hypothetical protein
MHPMYWWYLSWQKKKKKAGLPNPCYMNLKYFSEIMELRGPGSLSIHHLAFLSHCTYFQFECQYLYNIFYI